VGQESGCRQRSLPSLADRAANLPLALRRVEARGRYYTVGRLRSTASRVFQFGIGAAYCTSDPTRDLKEALTKAPKGNPRPALTDPDDVGELMRRIEVYDAKNGGLVRYALKLIALTIYG
jgi:Phage integrase central domain